MGEGDAVKIADFGMSREDEGGIYIVQSGTRNIPIKWTAPEVTSPFTGIGVLLFCSSLFAALFLDPTYVRHGVVVYSQSHP